MDAGLLENTDGGHRRKKNENRELIAWVLVVLLMGGFVAMLVLYLQEASDNNTDLPTSGLPPLRARAEEQREWITARTQEVLPELMDEYDVDVWVLSQKEYTEDTMWRQLTDPTRVNARRRTVMVYGRTEEGVQVSEFVGFDEWTAVKDTILSYSPSRVLVNVNETHAFADGLASGEYQLMSEQLGPEVMDVAVHDAPQLPIYWTAVRVDGMFERYRTMQELVHQLISRAFSSEVITPSTTETEDVAWWIKEQIHMRGLRPGFHPSVAVQRKGCDGVMYNRVVEEGDHIWVDMGLEAMNMYTDTQHQGYVLRKGESAAPQGLLDGLRDSNTMQDVLMRNIRAGITGDEALAQSAADIEEAGVDGWFYSHPIGDFMHSSGPAVGMVDQPNQPVPRSGWLTFRPRTWYSIELSAQRAVPEWDGQVVQFSQEEDAELTSDGDMRWILDRQTEFHLIDSYGVL